MRFSLLRTQKLSRGFVAYADFLTDNREQDKMDTPEKVTWSVIKRGQDKMDTHEKVKWSVIKRGRDKLDTLKR